MIRGFIESDLGFVQEVDFLLWLEIQYHGDFIRENIFTATDEKGAILGVVALSFHSSWYDRNDNKIHKLVLNYCFKNEEVSVLHELGNKALERAEELHMQYPGKKIGISCWFDVNEIEETQILLHQGFHIGAPIPVLSYDLTNDIVHYEIPEDITITQLGRSDQDIENYLEATKLANEGVADSKGELLFRSGDESFKVFVARNGNEIVAGMSIWNIGDGRCATENIFTIPSYRRKNIAKEVIVTGLEELKKSGQTIGTLSMLGNNDKAMRLYQKLGYKLMYHTVEVQYVL